MVAFVGKFEVLFALFLCVNLIATQVNHIDDTDETYGYWEPLHYLLWGRGMQTWEYAPEYAIRTYAFIVPFWCLGYVISQFVASKLAVFYGIRAVLGCVNAYISANFVKQVNITFGERMASALFVLMLASPGIFYASTAYLPSAATMSLCMLAFSSWLGDKYVRAIFWGCLAVLWTGWPFVGVILVPLGLHMLISTFLKTGVRGAFWLALSGAVVLVCVAAPPVLIDSYFYGKMYVHRCNTISLFLRQPV
jgi:alpha-1,2-mannosyltransferase